MLRLTVFLALILTLAACDSDADRSLDEIARAAKEASLAGDADLYVRLAREAAGRDDLGALRVLAEVGRRGYVQLGVGEQRSHEAYRLWPGEGTRWAERFEVALAQKAAKGSPDARFLLLTENHDGAFSMSIGVGGETEYRRTNRELLKLAEEGYGPAITMISMRLVATDTAAAQVWFDRATALGDKHACLRAASWIRLRGSGHAAGLARLLDRTMVCEGGQDAARTQLTPLFSEEARGNTATTALLDSVAALDVFERHPELLAGRQSTR